MRQTIYLVMLSFVVVACSGGTEETVAPINTTTTTAIDQSVPLLAALIDPAFEASGSIRGTYDVDGTVARFAGEMQGEDDEGRLRLEIFAPINSSYEQMFVRRFVFEREDDGPWVEDEASDNEWLWNYLGDITELSENGTVEVGNKTYHSFLPDIDIPLEAVGFAELNHFTSTTAFLADDEGMPAGFTVNLNGSQDGDPVTIEMQVEFENLKADPLEIPSDYFTRHSSTVDIPFTVGIPSEFTAEEEVQTIESEEGEDWELWSDAFYFDDDEISIYTYRESVPSLEGLSEDAQQSIIVNLRGDVLATSVERLGDHEWATFTYWYDDDTFGPTYGMYAAAEIDGGLMVIRFFSKPGTESEDVEFFRNVMSTVEVE